ncbi:MAG: PadR family transcriptional regulator [Candidatus Pacebacteria bacterium]|nr:PadR family transcriptional regulator [Candidatus Paceibacterota bacterium]
MTTIEEKFAPLKKGLLEFVTLTVISADKVYAADILATLAKTDFATQEGTLYPLLSKLRREALVDYEWIESESGPPRKYYSLTEKGHDQLLELRKYWHTMGNTIKSLGRVDRKNND